MEVNNSPLRTRAGPRVGMFGLGMIQLILKAGSYAEMIGRGREDGNEGLPFLG